MLRGKNKVVEIINADSRQFFRGFDIGTAKIAKKEMNNIPHHLIDVLEPSEKPTIAWFKDEATRTIDAIHARRNLPILCGGSMLYVSSIIDGLVPLSPVHPELRKKLSEEYDADYGVHLHEKLSEIDPEGAANIPKENKHHLIRAMEIVIVTGKKSSAQKKRVQSPYDLLMFGMSIPKKELDARIESRTRHMFAAGWVEEVQALLKAGVSVDDPAMESVGYTAIARRLQAGKTSKVIKEDRELFSEINRRTRQYAKRQMTWWRHEIGRASCRERV